MQTYTFRSFNNIDYALPTGSGSFVSVPENVRNNLSPYFEVLYKDWELADDPENASADSFYQGGRATWRDIATCSALHLDEDIEQRLAHQIKSYTGTAQEYNPQNKFFFLEHKAGIGGTTFVKQVAWSLHQDMAVLEVKRYDKDGTFRELQNLYDNVIGKNPILLVAEDTLPDLDAMCEAFLSSMRNRRCALLIACRENGGISSNYKSSHIEKFHQLKAGAIEALIHKFKSISKLSPAELEKKSRAFRDEVTGAMLTPFIIGLYFLEKDFHIDSYVGKVLDGSLPPMQKEMVRSEIGRLAKNTLSEEQVNHKVKFLAGFTLEGMWSIGPSVRDQSTGEVFDIPAILAALRDWGAGSVKSQKRQLEQAAPPPKAPPTSQPVRSALASRNNQESGERKTFHPKSVYPDNSKPKYLNGTVDDGKGSIKVSYLVDVFTEKKVEAYGGIRDILKTLIKAGSLDTKVENVRIEDGGKRYRLVLYDETIELPHLLGLQKKTAYDSHAPVTEEVGIQLPDLSGKSVEFIPSDPTLEQTNGTFLYKGATFAGKLLGIKSNNDRKRAQKFSGRIPAVVQGKPQAGKYNLKMKG